MLKSINNNSYSRDVEMSANITVGINKIHSLWFYYQAISGGAYKNELFEELFRQSRYYGNRKVKKLLNDFKEFNAPEISNKIFIASVKSKSIDHLETILSKSTGNDKDVDLKKLSEL